MTVFRNYFRIVNKHKFSILIYSIVFFVVTFIFSSSGQADASSYTSVNVDVAVINESQSELGKALETYINENMNVVDLKLEHIDDELFYGMIQSVITIPSDFEETQEVYYKSSPKIMYGMVVTQKINEFINKTNAYQKAGYSVSDSIQYTKDDLSVNTEMKLVEGSTSEEGMGAHFYFNFLHYVLMSQIVLIITTVMIVYNKEIIAKRNDVSPVSRTSQNLQLTLGHILMGAFVWAVYMGIFTLFWPDSLGTQSVKLMMFNSFIFMITIVTMAVFLSRLIINENTMSAITNVVTLGSSFLAGAFVPQEMLSDFTLSISKFLPSYYYIANNNMIVKNPVIQTMLPHLLIMSGFSVGFIILTILLKPKHQ